MKLLTNLTSISAILLFVVTVVSMSASVPGEARATIHGKSEVSLALPRGSTNSMFFSTQNPEKPI